MGFYLYIEHENGRAYRDEKWDGEKFGYRREFWLAIQRHWSDVVENMHYEDNRRPANLAEVAALKEEVGAWPSDHNRDLFLHAIDVVAQDPTLRFAPSY